MGLLQDLGAFTNPYGVPSTGQWNLLRGVYTTNSGQSFVFFFEKPDQDEPKTNMTGISDVTDSGGRRLAVYKYPYIDGQQVADMGREGETFTLNIKFWGLNYQKRMNDFIRVLLNDNSGGTVVHPVRGAIPARFRDHEFVHRYDEFSAVTIKAVFVEDNTGKIQLIQTPVASPDSKLRSALSKMVSAQAFIQQNIFAVQAILLLPGALANAMKSRLDSIVGQMSQLLGQLGVTFSSNQTLKTAAMQAAVLASGSITDLSSGTVQTVQTGGQVSSAQLPPVYQAGLDPTTQAAITQNLSDFANANQITAQQAVFAANQIRAAITAAIAEAITNFGNDSYDIVVEYRSLSVTIQDMVEAALASAQSKVKTFTVESPMSLRGVAKAAGLTPDRQNDIEALNPGLSSVNYLPAGTMLQVPVA